ncbi:MAG: fumarylacetoacetate hydrolase family protein [Aestuariivirgaceae bacterium]
MKYAFKLSKVPAVRVEGDDSVFPVHRIYCVGRNYAAHAIEMGGDPNREAPFFFQKNPDNLVIEEGDFPYPEKSSDVHHEIELVVALKGGGDSILVSQTMDLVFGYAVGLDMTRRDLQAECKKLGRPWEIAKAFERSAPISRITPVSRCGHRQQGAIWLKVDGKMRQEGDINQLIWKVPEIISYLSGYFTLKAGDLIMTGTPAGVGPVERGNVLHGHIEGIGELRTRVT